MQFISHFNYFKHKISVFFLFGTIFFASSCAKTDENTEKMIGEWDSNSVFISIKSAHQTGGDSIINIPTYEVWAKMMQLKPIHTQYRADHSYEATFRNLNDSIVALNLGVWTMRNDTTLQLIQQEPYPDTMEYDIRFFPNGAELRRFKYDFDKDGDKDDSFFGTQRKVK